MGGEEPDLLGPDPVPGSERPRFEPPSPSTPDPKQVPVIPFPGALWNALIYPFSSWAAVAFILVLAIGVDTLRLASQPGVLLVGRVAAWGLMGLAFSWGFRIFEESMAGKDRIPAAADFSEPAELVRDGFMVGCAYLSAFWPSLLLAWIAGRESWSLPWIGILNILGALHLPMALMLVGITNSGASAFNYPLAYRSAKRILRDFLLTAFFFQLQKNLIAFILYLAWRYAPRPGLHEPQFGYRLDDGFDIDYINVWIHLGGTIVEILFIAVSMRALGLLLRARRTELGWFRERGEPREGEAAQDSHN